MNLREWKEANDLSYAALAKKIGISKSFAFKVTNGYHFPRRDVMLRIAKATAGAVSAADILAGMKEP